LCVLGRSALSEERANFLRGLEGSAASVRYLQVDLADAHALQRAYDEIKQSHVQIDGVLQLVRAHESGSIVGKTLESFERVSRVKVESTYNLDVVTAREPLDFFMIFSSLGAHGARGDSDYAYSAAYQSAFAGYREQLRRAGQRAGTTITQCWGPWLEDRLFPDSRARMRSFGFGLIDPATVWPQLAGSLCAGASALSLMRVTDPQRVKDGFERSTSSDDSTPPAREAERALQLRVEAWERDQQRGRPHAELVAEVASVLGPNGVDALDEATLDRLDKLLCGSELARNQARAEVAPRSAAPAFAALEIRRIVAEVLELAEVDEEQTFQNYGVDSILAMKICTRIEKSLRQEVKPQWLLDYPTVRALSQYITDGAQA
jgi:rhizoxin synthesis polyketide synthase/nonribosomal peptide synthetase RhiB